MQLSAQFLDGFQQCLCVAKVGSQQMFNGHVEVPGCKRNEVIDCCFIKDPDRPGSRNIHDLGYKFLRCAIIRQQDIRANRTRKSDRLLLASPEMKKSCVSRGNVADLQP
jgi:hypothetical protein